jgi:hypothetical protein
LPPAKAAWNCSRLVSQPSCGTISIRFDIAAKLALGRTHQPKRSQLGHHRLEEAGVRRVPDDVVNGNAALGLLQREVAQVG